MLGPRKHTMKGETTRCGLDPVHITMQKLDVLKSIMKICKGVELSADFIHLNDVPFMTTMSNNIHHGTIDALANLKCPTLEFELKNVISSYTIRGFRITMIIFDTQSKALKDRNL